MQVVDIVACVDIKIFHPPEFEPGHLFDHLADDVFRFFFLHRNDGCVALCRSIEMREAALELIGRGRSLVGEPEGADYLGPQVAGLFFFDARGEGECPGANDGAVEQGEGLWPDGGRVPPLAGEIRSRLVDDRQRGVGDGERNRAPSSRPVNEERHYR